MTVKFRSIFLLLLVSVTMNQCVDPFELESIGTADLLVVEGVLSDQPGTQVIRLSRSAPVDATEFVPEENATVVVVNQEGFRVPFNEFSPGIYHSAPFFAGTVGSTYRLEIITENGNSYESDEVTLKRTPPIEEISAEFVRSSQDVTIDDDAIKIYVRTGDPLGETRFYRWEWEETYEINTPLASDFEWIEGNTVIRREFPTDRCWASDTSASILIKSTQNLEEDIVFRQLVRTVPSISEAWRVKYSILVKQYALSEEGHLFWERLQTINEGSGSLFDQQPAAVIGNVRSTTNNNETVLGYFDAAQIREMRVFYTPEDFASQGFSPSSRSIVCEQDTVAIDRIGEYMEFRQSSAIEYSIIDVDIASFLVAPTLCSDCTKKGTNEMPPFWE